MSKRYYNKKNITKYSNINNSSNNNTNNNQESLTEDEVKNILDFASSYYTEYAKGCSSANGSFTPDMVNEKLQEITMNPIISNESLVENALSHPISMQQELIGLSEYFELTDMLVKRTMNYLSGILSFDYTFIPTNIKDIKEYNSIEYKESLNKVKEFLNKFNVKEEFKNVMKTLIRQETGYYVFRNDSVKYNLQELPQKYCKITGRWDYGLIFDFDTNWFLQSGVSIDMYPKSMCKLFERVYGISFQNYDPANPLKDRKGTFSTWGQTSPLDGFWAFKLNPNRISNVPFLSSMFPEAVLRPLIRKLQTNQYLISAQKVMVGLIPTLQNVKSGQIKDQLAISPKAMGEFLYNLKRGLTDAIKVTGVPFSDVKTLDFKPNDKDMLQQYNQTTSSSLGVTSRYINAADKMSASEVLGSQNIDEFMMLSAYYQFSDFLDYQVNRISGKYKFKFTFEGTEFNSDKTQRFNRAKEMSALGFVLPQKFASALGMNIFELQTQLQMAKASKITDDLITLLNLNTGFGTNNADKKNGRPKSSVENASESSLNKDDFIPNGGD